MGTHKTTIELDHARESDMVVRVQLYEPIDTGSTTYTLSPLEVLIPARRIRVANVELKEVPRVAQTQASSRPKRHATADFPVARPTDKFKLMPEALLEIRAEMPTVDDSWDVEDVVQYRTYYRKEQWLIKWQGYGELPTLQMESRHAASARPSGFRHRKYAHGPQRSRPFM